MTYGGKRAQPGMC